MLSQDSDALGGSHLLTQRGLTGENHLARLSPEASDLQNLRAGQACEFLLADAKFISWYRAFDSQQLVILGDMGCRKSVAMALLVDELRRRNEHQLPQPRICYHYCQDDETDQTIYIFSALILSLLEQLSGLKKIFLNGTSKPGRWEISNQRQILTS